MATVHVRNVSAMPAYTQRAGSWNHASPGPLAAMAAKSAITMPITQRPAHDGQRMPAISVLMRNALKAM